MKFVNMYYNIIILYMENLAIILHCYYKKYDNYKKVVMMELWLLILYTVYKERKKIEKNTTNETQSL